MEDGLGSFSLQCSASFPSTQVSSNSKDPKAGKQRMEDLGEDTESLSRGQNIQVGGGRYSLVAQPLWVFLCSDIVRHSLLFICIHGHCTEVQFLGSWLADVGVSQVFIRRSSGFCALFTSLI